MEGLKDRGPAARAGGQEWNRLIMMEDFANWQ